MDYLRNPKILGSFLIGFALVGGTYTLMNFGEPRLAAPEVPSATIANVAPVRAPIPINDSDGDGVGDWRDQFITAPAIVINEKDQSLSYTPPETLTAQFGISLVEDLIRVKIGGPVAKTNEQVLEETVAEITRYATSDKIYSVGDINLGTDGSREAVRVYGNALAEIIVNHNVPGLEGELDLLLAQAVSQESLDNTDKIRQLSTMYKNYRDETLSLAVPPQFVKVHLDLINVYNALHMTIDGMAKANSDPLVSLARLKRYEEDVKGLVMALANMYDSLLPYADVFAANDPIMVFARFYQKSP